MADKDSAPRVKDTLPPRVEDGGEEGTKRMEVEETVTVRHRDTLPEVPSGQKKEECEITDSSVERNHTSIDLAALQSLLVEVDVCMKEDAPA